MIGFNRNAKVLCRCAMQHNYGYLIETKHRAEVLYLSIRLLGDVTRGVKSAEAACSQWPLTLD